MPDTDIPTYPAPPDECPIMTLINGPRLSEMTDDQLEVHMRELRTATESPQTMRKLLSKAGGTTKRKTPPKPIDLADLDL